MVKFNWGNLVSPLSDEELTLRLINRAKRAQYIQNKRKTYLKNQDYSNFFESLKSEIEYLDDLDQKVQVKKLRILNENLITLKNSFKEQLKHAKKASKDKQIKIPGYKEKLQQYHEFIDGVIEKTNELILDFKKGAEKSIEEQKKFLKLARKNRR